MKNNLLTWKKTKGCTIDCEIDLGVMFEGKDERERFDGKWKEFIASDPDNKKVFWKRSNKLIYRSEQLIPTKKDERPPLFLIFGNPATHSVEKGMFFSSKSKGKGNRFWKLILNSAGVLNLPFDPRQSVEKLNAQRRQSLFNLKYDSPFRISLGVFISIPSAPSGKWGGVTGIQKLIGTKALRRLEAAERDRVMECSKKFLTPNGAVITFQKNAWNGLRSNVDLPYNIDLAKAGKLQGKLRDNPDIPIFGIPPTRLTGPCRNVLHQVLLEFRGQGRGGDVLK
jgi:hypothetical protein